MKKILKKINIPSFFWIVVCAFFASPLTAFGVIQSGGLGLKNPLRAQSIEGLLADVVIIVRDIGIVVAVIFLVYSGFLFVTAQGDPSKLSKAKASLLWAVIGIGVLVGAQILATTLDNTVTSLGS